MRGGILVLGGGLLIAHVIHLFIDLNQGHEPLVLALGTFAPAVLSGGIVMSSYWLLRNDVNPMQLGRVTRWVVAGIAIIVAAGGGLIVYERSGSSQLAHAALVIANFVVVGVIGGLVVGWYTAYVHKKQRELRGFKRAVECAGHGVILTDVDGTIQYANPAFEEITGRKADEIVGHSPREFSADEQEHGFSEEMCQTVREGRIWEGEVLYERADGSTCHVDKTIAPVFDRQGHVDQFVAVSNDITERKEMERQLKEQRDDLEVLNQVVRHDIRNDLVVIEGYARELESHVADEGREYVTTITERTEDAISLTNRARELAETTVEQQTTCKPVSLRPILRDVADDVDSSYSDAVITIESQISNVEVLADGMLSSVFRNLLTNAVHHNDKDVPEVTVSAGQRDGRAVVSVADNGPGIPDERKTEVFEKGHRRADSDGTGLGLYLVKTLVDQYGGDISIEDNDPEGTVFVIEFDRVDADHAIGQQTSRLDAP
jgi:PAS domain S-box-containing protein